jgi:D-psicose/D-tagatose/L-ribulose 3-epimerase
MNKIGMFYAYWTHEWDADFHPYIDKAANLGFDILEVHGDSVGKMTPEERKALKKHAVDRNIDLTYCIGLPEDCDPASPDESIRRRGIALVQKMAQGIGEMGGGTLSGILYGWWPTTLPKGETDRRPFLERSLTSVREAIKAAEDNNVILCMEVVNRFEHFLLNTAEEGVSYVKQVGSPNAKLLLDTFHMNIEEDHIGTAIETAGNYLGHVHLGESNRRPPGTGHIPWDELASALKKINYQGALVMEPFLMPGGQVGSDIKVWRDLSTGVDIDAEAAKAVRFMRSKLAAAQ